MPVIDCSGVTLHYEISGNPSGPYLILSNSLGTDLTMWHLQVEAFGEFFRVLRYDMRGHGGSAVPPNSYSIEQLGTDVIHLLDGLGVAHAHFCGLSIGGVIGQWLAANAPQRLRRLVLCNTAARIGTHEIWNDRIEKVVEGGMESIADGVLSRWFSESFAHSQPADVAAMRHVLTTTSPAGYISSCEAIRDMDQRQMVKHIATPTLIIAGSFDTVTTVSDGVALQESIVGSHMSIVPGAHISNVEASSYFNTAVLSFLREGLL